MKEYQVVNGTSYHKDTASEIIKILENSRVNRERIIVDYGDTKTGQSWGERHDIAGIVGRSTGSVKIPLLVHNRRSLGGPGMLDHCIVKIVTSKGKRVLYQHENYKPCER